MKYLIKSILLTIFIISIFSFEIFLKGFYDSNMKYIFIINAFMPILGILDGYFIWNTVEDYKDGTEVKT